MSLNFDWRKIVAMVSAAGCLLKKAFEVPSKFNCTGIVFEKRAIEPRDVPEYNFLGNGALCCVIVIDEDGDEVDCLLPEFMAEDIVAGNCISFDFVPVIGTDYYEIITKPVISAINHQVMSKKEELARA